MLIFAGEPDCKAKMPVPVSDTKFCKKVPKAIVFCELPKTSTGKIQKFELRKQAGSASAIDV